jgi:hypothetical protein
MTQPGKLPDWATDETYSAGEYAGAPTKIEPSSGLKASGVVPKTRVAAQRFNWLLNNAGEHVATLAPLAVDNWGVQIPIALGPVVETMTYAGRLIQGSSSGRLFARGLGGGGGSTEPFHYSSTNPELDVLADWTGAATAGSDPDNYVSPMIKSDSLIVCARIALGQNHRFSTDLGATWANAGICPAAVKEGHYFAAVDRFILLGDGNGDVFSLAAASIPTIGTTAWDSVTNVLTGTPVPQDIGSNANECVAVYDDGRVIRSTNGTTWSAPVTLANWAGLVAGLAWNESQGLWCIINSTGKTWFSPTGAVWTEGIDFVTGTLQQQSRIAALGRYWICVSGNSIRRFDQEEIVDTGVKLRSTPSTGVSQVISHTYGRAVAYIAEGNNIGYAFSQRLLG